MQKEREAELSRTKKLKGIITIIIDKTFKLVSMSFNKLIFNKKFRKELLTKRLKFILQTVINKDKNFIFHAYNLLCRRRYALQHRNFKR